MKVLILGSTGMLGESLSLYFKAQGFIVHGVARQQADYNIDIVKQLPLLANIIEQNNYDIIINTVALVNLNYCEEHPEQAYLVNTKVAGDAAAICHASNIYFVQISTDHYYIGDRALLHSEEDSVVLLNEYAKTKYLAEKLVEQYGNTLIVRTNIVGYRQQQNLTFVEWIIDSLINEKTISGYTNMYVSSIDVDAFSYILGELVNRRVTGLINVGADGVLSKFEFISLLAKKFNKEYLVQESNLVNGAVVRGDSLGLNIDKLKKYYQNIEVPTAVEVIDRLYEQYVNKEI